MRKHSLKGCYIAQNESDGRALWDELKRLNRGVKCTTNTLDGHSTNADIVEHLATKYRSLFSSQTTTEAKLNNIRHVVIQDKVTCEGNAFVVTVTEVCEMTSKLKINKSDGLTGSCSDHFEYAPHRFAVPFTMLGDTHLQGRTRRERTLEASRRQKWTSRIRTSSVPGGHTRHDSRGRGKRRY